MVRGIITYGSILGPIIILVATVSISVAAGCASGFMELEVLRKRAEKISNGNPSSNVLDDEFRLIPDWNFTCDGIITSLLLGVDIQVGESDYPQVQIWRRNGSVSDEFNKIDSREIALVVGNFTPSVVFQCRLTSPMHFQSGDVLGIFQPPQEDSSVRLYYNSSDDSAPVAYRLQHDPGSAVNIVGMSPISGEYILFSLFTGRCHSVV